METDKEHLEYSMVYAIKEVGRLEFSRITARTDSEELQAIHRKELWQKELMDLEKRYRKLKLEEKQNDR